MKELTITVNICAIYMKSQTNVAVQRKGFRLDGFYLKGFHYHQSNDLKLLCFLSLCRIKGSESIYHALERINNWRVREYPSLGS